METTLQCQSPTKCCSSLRAHAGGAPHLAILDDSVLIPTLLAEYSIDPDPLVRQGVAVHPRTTDETRLGLVRGDDDSDVIEAARRKCPDHFQVILALALPSSAEELAVDRQARAIITASRSGAPIFCWGSGTGKGELFQSVADRVDAHLETVLPGTLDPASITGTQVVNGKATSVVPVWADRLLQAGKAGKKTMVVFDNVDVTTPEQQDAVAQVMLLLAVGGQPLPTGIIILAAGDSGAAWMQQMGPFGRTLKPRMLDISIP